jgi:small GTP-binding protein
VVAARQSEGLGPTPKQPDAQMAEPSEAPSDKVVLLGSTGVGKTALVDRVANNLFNNSHIPTVGAQYVSVEMKVEDDPCPLELWDTAGQEVFRSLVGFYTREAAGVFLLFDLTSGKSYTDLTHWLDFLQENAPTAKVIIFGNKSDLAEEREITAEAAEEFAIAHSCVYFEGSAKTGLGVRDAFDKMAELVFSKEDRRKTSTVVLTAKPKNAKKKCC